MAHVLPCFTIPILVGSLDIDLQELKDHLLKHKDDRIDDNILASKFEDSECPYHPLVEELITSVCDVVRQKTECGPLDCNRIWSHIHEKNMSTEWHTHETDLAGVFYVSTPKDSGSLVFRRPDQEPVVIPPQEGLFVVFPGWVEHKVTRTHSEDLRMSISFNLNYE